MNAIVGMAGRIMAYVFLWRAMILDRDSSSDPWNSSQQLLLLAILIYLTVIDLNGISRRK